MDAMRCDEELELSGDSCLAATTMMTDDQITGCIRCGRRVYKAEQVEFGLELHKRCFRCCRCDMTLSLKSYVIAKVNDMEDVFCSAHAPQASSKTFQPAFGMHAAAGAQHRISRRQSFNTQVGILECISLLLKFSCTVIGRLLRLNFSCTTAGRLFRSCDS